MRFTHIDFNISDIMVNDDQTIVPVDRDMAGFFGWKGAGEVHGRIKTLHRQHFVGVWLSETLRKLISWNKLHTSQSSLQYTPHTHTSYSAAMQMVRKHR